MLNPHKYKEFNELIANYMSLEKDEESGKWLSPMNGSKIVNLKYHESWDWLMPVIEKINNLKYEDYKILFRFDFKDAQVVSISDYLTILEDFETDEPSWILTSYAKCIKIIKWLHNENK